MDRLSEALGIGYCAGCGLEIDLKNIRYNDIDRTYIAHNFKDGYWWFGTHLFGEWGSGEHFAMSIEDYKLITGA